MRNPLAKFAAVVCVILACGAGAGATGPEPLVLPTCDSPQALAPSYTFGSYLYGRNGVAWNGREYAVAYIANSGLYFRRFYADGTPVATPVPLASGMGMGTAYQVGMVWNGTGYAIAYPSGSPARATLLLVDSNGAILHGPRVGSVSSATCRYIGLATSGNGYGVVWSDVRNGNSDIWASHFDATGEPTFQDLPVHGTQMNDQDYPSVAWSPAGFYEVVWQDYRTGSKMEIYASYFRPNGTGVGESVFATGSGNSYYPHIASAGAGLGVVWADTRDSNYEVYFARISSLGSKIGSDLRVTNDAATSTMPHLVATGGEYEAFFVDTRGGSSDVWHQRISLAGALQGTATQLMAGVGTTYPTAAFATKGFLVTAAPATGGGPLTLQPLGCSYAAFPPCPENAMAYNVSRSQATLSWLPVVDPYFDVAYYQVYRNNTLVGTSSSNVFTDTGLTAGATYNYALRAVNASQMVSTGCPTGSSVYVKTDAALKLTVAKSGDGPDARLSWTDAGMSFYNVFRGTDPQVMCLVDTTGGLSDDDPGVLLDDVLYFYTVDDPGQ